MYLISRSDLTVLNSSVTYTLNKRTHSIRLKPNGGRHRRGMRKCSDDKQQRPNEVGPVACTFLDLCGPNVATAQRQTL